MDEKTQPSRRPFSLVAAEQNQARISSGEPLPMTQEEVEVMAKGGNNTRKIVDRMASHGAAAAVHSEKASPVAITTDDLEKINTSGELPAKIRQRLEESGRVPAESIVRAVVSEKSAPTATPPEAS